MDGSILRLIVVVNDLDLRRSKLGPHEADPVLIVHADAVLRSSVSLERLQPVARRNAKVGKSTGGIDQVKFPTGDLPEA